MNAATGRSALAVLFIVVLVTPGRASTVWFSPTSNPTLADNPFINVTPGQNFSVYVFVQMSPGQSITGISLDVARSNTNISRLGTPAASYFIQNPDYGSGPRWSTWGTGGSSPPSGLLIDNAASSNFGGSQMGFADPPSADPTYNAATDSYYYGRLDLVAGLLPQSTELRFGLGSGGVLFRDSPGGAFLAPDTPINFGVGDAPLAGNDSRRSSSTAVSLVADATIVVIPEPSTLLLALLGSLALLASQRTRAACRR